MSEREKFETVDQYLETFSGETKSRLEAIRQVAQSVAPDAEEVISYNIPALKIGKDFLTYFSGYDAHVSISFVPTDSVYEKFKTELADNVKSKSTIQFATDKPLPIDVIQKILEFRLNELRQK